MPWICDELLGLRLEDVPGGWLGVLAACASVYVSYKLCQALHYQYRVSLTKNKIKWRQGEREQNVIKMKQQIFNSEVSIDASIASLEFGDLHRRLQEGQLTASEVLLAFQHQALHAHKELNCVTEFLDDAMERAKKMDQLPREKRGPLHGIPISLKESVVLAGRDATTGFARSIGHKFEENGLLLQVLIDQGAIPFARTNVPQGQMSIDCSNPIFGLTRNPKDPTRTCGGSTGGEGALIGAGASILGLGCDMGGSIRVPCHFCGVTGIKCTPNRLSNGGNYPFCLGIVSLAEVYSPMGRDVDSIVTFMKAALVPRLYELDPLLPRMPWNDQLYESKKPLKIGYYISDGGVEPVPAVARAVKLAVKNLQAMGHTVVEFQPPDLYHAYINLFFGILSGDGGKTIQEFLKYDVVDPCIKAMVPESIPIPAFVKKLIALLPKMHPITKALLHFEGPQTIADWWDKNEELEEYRRMFTGRMRSQGISCLVCPVLPFVSWPIEKSQPMIEALTYTSLYNVLDFPAGVVPTTTVTEADVKAMKTNYPSPDLTYPHKFIHEITEGSQGLPVGVQCVGLPFEEETALRLMKDLESSLKNNS